MSVQTAHAEIDEFVPADPGKLGLWLFLLSEMLLFGAFFASYFMMRWGSSVCRLGAPAWPAHDYGTTMGLATLNTFILITSSFTMVSACRAIEAADEKRFARRLVATIALGACFLLVKAAEYTLKIRHGYYPGGSFAEANPGYGIFFSFYFVMTGLHAVHVVAGLIWNTLLLRCGQDRRSHDFARKAEYAGLYWHFVDVIWVFLYPIFYLV